MKIKDLRSNSVDPDENSLSADSSVSTVFANSAIFVFLALQVQPFNLYVDQTAHFFEELYVLIACRY